MRKFYIYTVISTLLTSVSLSTVHAGGVLSTLRQKEKKRASSNQLLQNIAPHSQTAQTAKSVRINFAGDIVEGINIDDLHKSKNEQALYLFNKVNGALNTAVVYRNFLIDKIKSSNLDSFRALRLISNKENTRIVSLFDELNTPCADLANAHLSINSVQNVIDKLMLMRTMLFGSYAKNSELYNRNCLIFALNCVNILINKDIDYIKKCSHQNKLKIQFFEKYLGENPDKLTNWIEHLTCESAFSDDINFYVNSLYSDLEQLKDCDYFTFMPSKNMTYSSIKSKMKHYEDNMSTSNSQNTKKLVDFYTLHAQNQHALRAISNAFIFQGINQNSSDDTKSHAEYLFQNFLNPQETQIKFQNIPKASHDKHEEWINFINKTLNPLAKKYTRQLNQYRKEQGLPAFSMPGFPVNYKASPQDVLLKNLSNLQSENLDIFNNLIQQIQNIQILESEHDNMLINVDIIPQPEIKNEIIEEEIDTVNQPEVIEEEISMTDQSEIIDENNDVLITDSLFYHDPQLFHQQQQKRKRHTKQVLQHVDKYSKSVKDFASFIQNTILNPTYKPKWDDIVTGLKKHGIVGSAKDSTWVFRLNQGNNLFPANSHYQSAFFNVHKPHGRDTNAPLPHAYLNFFKSGLANVFGMDSQKISDILANHSS